MIPVALLTFIVGVAALPNHARALLPTVQLDYGTFQGTTVYSGANSFLGMPFAVAGRLENPRVIGASDTRGPTVQDATRYGPACPQQQLVASPGSSDNAEVGSLLSAIEQLLLPAIENQGEDCLSINVQVPLGINSTAGLPVLFWIHGGGFELGSSASFGAETTALAGFIYQGANIVKYSVQMNQPIIFVSANHRLNAFGTLASQEINDAGIPNLLLKDQRVAMQWIQKYISKFGGDPKKVTLFGESAGSLAIATHMLLNDGNDEGLFRGAIMASGGVMKLKDYHRGQETFDFIAQKVGCSTSTNKIACLKSAPYNSIYNAVQQLPNFLSYDSSVVPWYPRPDGTYLKDSPHRLLRSGKISKVPYIIGDMKDEGTVFSVAPATNTTTDADFQDFFHTVFFNTLSAEQIKAFTDQYSQDQAAGSPFDTGEANAILPQYKRIAAAVGDYTFQAGRRDLLEHTYNTNKAYTYLIEQSLPLLGQVGLLDNAGLAQLPVLGSFHVSDVLFNDFGLIPPTVSQNSKNIMSTFIAFTNSLDPNTHGVTGLPTWPQWNPTNKAMFQYAEDGCTIIKDDFRETQMRFMNDNADIYVY